MSGLLQINFANDMPGASVEVIAPSQETVGRVWIDPGGTASIDVPSEGSFLRVHLPSGQVVTVLEGRGNLHRQISLANLLPPTTTTPSPGKTSTTRKSARRRRDVRSPFQYSSPTATVPPAVQFDNPESTAPQSGDEPPAEQFANPPTNAPQLDDGSKVQLTWADGQFVPGAVNVDGKEILFARIERPHACELSLTGPGGHLRVQLPGMLKEIYVRADNLDDGLRVVNVGVATLNKHADGLMAYMTRGDLYSAESLISWADRAEQMLYDKISDPFAAMVGAYLLLKLRRFELMRSWARNLADNWPELPDGNVIWAWQLIHQREPSTEAEIRGRLEKAAAARMPIFSEGLNLLRDGLRLLGPESQKSLERLNQQAGILLCDSPFTAGLHDRLSTSGARTQFSVGYRSLPT